MKLFDMIKNAEENGNQNIYEMGNQYYNQMLFSSHGNNATQFMRNLELLGLEGMGEVLEYLRKSRQDMEYYKDEDISKTLQRHRDELDDFCKAKFGQTIPEENIFKEVKSGDSINDREEIQKLLSLIENPKYKAVLVLEIERLARGDTIDQGIIIQSFQYTNTKIITPQRIYDLSNENDLSEFESGLQKARAYLKYVKGILARGRKRSVTEGKFVGSIAPFGYKKKKLENAKGFTLEKNEEEGECLEVLKNTFLYGINETYIVKEGNTISSIAKYYATNIETILKSNLDVLKEDKPGRKQRLINKLDNPGDLDEVLHILRMNVKYFYFKKGTKINIIIEYSGTTTTANYLNINNYKSKTGKDWTAHSVRCMLDSFTRAGYLTWDLRKSKNYMVDGEVKTSTPFNPNAMITKGLHEAYFTGEETELIQEKLRRSSSSKLNKDKTIQNPLAGLVRCEICGKNMQRRPPLTYERNKKTERVHRFTDSDIKELSEFMRKYKRDYLNPEIAEAVGVHKATISKWFSPNFNSIPSSKKWPLLKQFLNIPNSHWDEKLTKMTEVGSGIIRDTLICHTPRCTNVGNPIHEVEDKILQAIKTEYINYKNILKKYKKTKSVDNIDYKKKIKQIEYDLEQVKNQRNIICDKLEKGIYSDKIFIERNKALDTEETKHQENIEKYRNLTLNSPIKQIEQTIPKIEKILENYNDNLTAEEKNLLLHSIIDHIIYRKEKRRKQGDKSITFELDIKIKL